MSSQRAPKPVRSYHLIALFLLLAFVAQCAWFVASVPLTQLEVDRVYRGLGLLRHVSPDDGSLNGGSLDGGSLDAESGSSPMVPFLSVAGILFHPFQGSEPQGPGLPDQFWLDQHRWFVRAPFLFAGLCLAVSLWYVARKLYGTAAGNIVLALYAFSPGMVACSSLAGPQIFAAWGGFGLIFTAIATAHTLYAPREVILWNWKRIALLGVSITFAAGAQWPLAWLLLPAAGFMLWAVPHRRGAALLIVFAAALVALTMLDLCYLGNFGALAHGLIHADWIGSGPRSLSPRLLGRMLGTFFFDAAPGALLGSVFALAAWCASRRIRFFGNTAPLIVFVLLLGMGIFPASHGVSVILFATLPFLLLFSAGVFADLIEGKLQAPALAVIFALIAAQAAYSVASLMRMYSRLPGS